MARRPVFAPDRKRLLREEVVELRWYPGFSVQQKRRSVRALHEAAADTLGLGKILEVSTKSEPESGADGEPLGQQFSALRIRKILPDGRSTLLEAAFQGSKVFVDGTPLNYTLVNTKAWCKNTFEVVNQIRINTDYSHHRYDVAVILR